jgi:hypothetical protein
MWPTLTPVRGEPGGFTVLELERLELELERLELERLELELERNETRGSLS